MPVTPKYRGSTKYLLVYAALINAAHTRTTVSYKQIAALMGLPPSGNYMSHETGVLLGEISEEEHGHGRPMLSALAIRADGMPGGGFFGLARDLGLLRDESAAGERQFWEAHKQALYDTWSSTLRQ